MEVLGAVASSIAVGQMIVAGRHVVSLIQQIPEILNEFNDLRDEICLMNGMAESVKKLFDTNSSSKRDPSDHENLLLNRALQQVNAIAVDLEQIVTSCARTPTSTKPSIVKRRKWILQEGRIEKLLSKAVNVKMNLHFVLSMRGISAHSEENVRQQRALAEILFRFESFRLQHSKALPPTTSNGTEESGGKFPARKWSEDEHTSDSLDDEPRLSASLVRDPHSPPAQQEDAIWLQSIVPLQGRCEKSCRCRCHFSSKTSSTAGWLRPLLGSYLVQYNTVPGLRKQKCTEPTCIRRDDAYLRLEYQFPWWLSAAMASFVASFNCSTRLKCTIRPKRMIPEYHHVWYQMEGSGEQFHQFILNDEGTKYFPNDESEGGDGLIEYAICRELFDALELLLRLWKDVLPQHGLPITVGFEARRRLEYRVNKTDREANLLLQAISWANDDIDTRRTRVFEVLLQGEDVGEALKEEPWAVDVVDSELGMSPLHFAAQENQPENLRQLIAAGANVNLKDSRGWAPLMNAALSGSVECLQLLLQAKSCVGQKNRDGRTALHWAVYNGQVETVSMLLAAGASVTAADPLGRTPLHDLRYLKPGIGLERVEMLTNRLLAAKDAKIDLRDNLGNTPTMLALIHDNLPVFHCLMQVGGTVHSINQFSSNILHVAALFASLDILLYLDGLQLTDIDTEKYDGQGRTPWDALRYTIDNPVWWLGGCRKPTFSELQAFARFWMGIHDRNLQQDIEALEQIIIALRASDVNTAPTELNALITRKQDWNWDENGVLSWYRAVSGRIRAGGLIDAINEIEAAIKDFRADMGTYPWGGKPETNEPEYFTKKSGG